MESDIEFEEIVIKQEIEIKLNCFYCEESFEFESDLQKHQISHEVE